LGRPFSDIAASAEFRLELLGALEQLLVAVDVERRERRPRRRADAPNRCSRGTARSRARAVHEGVVDGSRTITPPIGTAPLVTPLAKVIMSGVTP
jgi:hypothetical protein